MPPLPSPSSSRREATTEMTPGSTTLGQSIRDHRPSFGSQRSGVSSRSPLPPPLPLVLPSMDTLDPSPDTVHSTAPLRIGFRSPSRASTRQNAKGKSKGVAALEIDRNTRPPTMHTPSRRFRSLTRKAALADLRLRKSGSTSSARSTGFYVNATPIPPPTKPATPVSPSSPTSPLLTPHFSSTSKRLKTKSQKLLRKFSLPVWKLRGSGRLFGGKSSGRSPTTAPSDEEYHGQSTADDTRNLVSFYQLQSMPCRDFLSSPLYAQGGSIGPGSARTSTSGREAQAKPGLRKSQSLQDLMRMPAPSMQGAVNSYNSRSSVLRGSSGKAMLEHTGSDPQWRQGDSEGTKASSSTSQSFNEASLGPHAFHDDQPITKEHHQPKDDRHYKPSSTRSDNVRTLHKAHESSASREPHINTASVLLDSSVDQTSIPNISQARDHPYRTLPEDHDGDTTPDNDDFQTPVATTALTCSTPVVPDHRQHQSSRAHRHGMLSSVTIQDAFAYDYMGRSTPNVFGSPSRASSTLSPTRTSCSRGGASTAAAGKDAQQRSNHSSILSWDTDHKAAEARAVQEEDRIREQILAACARQEEYMQSFKEEYARRGAGPRSTVRAVASDVALAPHRISTVVSGSEEALLAIDLLDLRRNAGEEEAAFDTLRLPNLAGQQDTARTHGGSLFTERQRKTSLGQLFGAPQPPIRPARSPRLPPTTQLGASAGTSDPSTRQRSTSNDGKRRQGVDLQNTMSGTSKQHGDSKAGKGN